MSIVIREVDVRTERDAFVRFLGDNLDDHGGAAHFDWLYLHNPAGTARAWIAMQGDALIGAAAAFPRRVRVQGEPIECWVLGDFAIRQDQRALGPAIALQRACLEGIRSGAVPFAFDHPSRAMMAVYRWLRVERTGEIVRYARPLRLDKKIREVLGDGPIARGAGDVGNAILTAQRRLGRGRGAGRVNRLERRFDASVDDLGAGLADRCGVVVDRTPEYLNWRYLDCPVQSYEVLVLEHDGIRGYLVFSESTDMVTVADLCGASADDEARLLTALPDHVNRTGVQTISFPVLRSTAIEATLSSCGYRARESTDFVVLTRTEGELDGIVNAPSQWHHTDGDRDV